MIDHAYLLKLLVTVYGADILGMMWGDDMRKRKEEKPVFDNNRPLLSVTTD